MRRWHEPLEGLGFGMNPSVYREMASTRQYNVARFNRGRIHRAVARNGSGYNRVDRLALARDG